MWIVDCLKFVNECLRIVNHYLTRRKRWFSVVEAESIVAVLKYVFGYLMELHACITLLISVLPLSEVNGERTRMDGDLIILSATQLETAQLFAVMGILSLSGITSFGIFSWIERRFFSYGREQL